MHIKVRDLQFVTKALCGEKVTAGDFSGYIFELAED